MQPGHGSAGSLAQIGVGPQYYNPAAHFELNDDEILWRDRYNFLAQRGYLLRRRYHPSWTPSWTGTTVNPAFCEDGIEQILPMVLDATRKKDSLIVCIKMIEKRTNEVEIARYLSSDALLRDTKNHSVLVLDSFCDPILPEIDYLVMPVLRPFDDPEFGALGEVVDFTTQILEGLAFIHGHNIAHGDCTSLNIMMDARPILPHGWHFVRDKYTPDGLHDLAPLARIDHPVRYYIVDYGLASRLQPGEPHLVTGGGGRDQDVPELSDPLPHDPFKVDVFTVGNVLFRDFTDKYLGLEFLDPLVSAMKTTDPRQRPTAQIALEHWYSIKAGLNDATARWRLRKPDESVSQRLRLNTIAAARQGIYNLKKFVPSCKRRPCEPFRRVDYI